MRHERVKSVEVIEEEEDDAGGASEHTVKPNDWPCLSVISSTHYFFIHVYHQVDPIPCFCNHHCHLYHFPLLSFTSSLCPARLLSQMEGAKLYSCSSLAASSLQSLWASQQQ